MLEPQPARRPHPPLASQHQDCQAAFIITGRPLTGITHRRRAGSPAQGLEDGPVRAAAAAPANLSPEPGHRPDSGAASARGAAARGFARGRRSGHGRRRSAEQQQRLGGVAAAVAARLSSPGGARLSVRFRGDTISRWTPCSSGRSGSPLAGRGCRPCPSGGG